MRALGYMSNRGRQNVADFLAGQLHVDWRLGAEWFEALLVDHDVCSNYGNWTYGALHRASHTWYCHAYACADGQWRAWARILARGRSTC